MKRLLYKLKRKRYLNSIRKFAAHINPPDIYYIDVGARGNLQEPWKTLHDTNIVKVVGFEPDRMEFDRLSATFPNRKYYPYAVGNKNDTNIKLSIAKTESCSSIHKPNIDYIKQHYLTDNFVPRITSKTIDVPSITLSRIPENLDFIKIDTQGYEREVLEGSGEKLNESLCILAETWNSEIHKGQKLSSSVLQFLEGYGFRLLGMQHGNWKRKEFEKFPLSRGSPVWSELLMYNESLIHDQESAKKAAVITASYGFPNLAYTILKNANVDFDEPRMLKLFNPLKLLHFNLIGLDWPKLH